VTSSEVEFDPRAVLAALQRAEVSFVVIGGLARVIRGADEVTWGVDICPSLLEANRLRVQAALDELQAEMIPAGKGRGARRGSGQQPVVEFQTIAGAVKVVVAPVGVPRGYDALRPGATIEHLGGGLRASIAATADLITMVAARGPQDLALVAQLQRILQLEASPARIVETPAPGHELPGPTHQPPGREL
jgi:hypothetical protein